MGAPVDHQKGWGQPQGQGTYFSRHWYAQVWSSRWHSAMQNRPFMPGTPSTIVAFELGPRGKPRVREPRIGSHGFKLLTFGRQEKMSCLGTPHGNQARPLIDWTPEPPIPSKEKKELFTNKFGRGQPEVPCKALQLRP